MEVNFVEKATGNAVEAVPIQFIANTMNELALDEKATLNHLLVKWSAYCYSKRNSGNEQSHESLGAQNLVTDPMIANFKWFVENYQAIYSLYGICYVIIHNQSLVAVFNTFHDALREARRNYETGTYNVQYCNGDKSGYTAYCLETQK